MTRTGTMKVAHYGLGPIGIEAMKLALTKRSLEVVGAVDIDPEKTGRDLGELAGLDHALGVKVSPDMGSLLSGVKPDVVVHTTHSRLKRIHPQIMEIVSGGSNVVSSAEALFFPSEEDGALTRGIDALAKEKGVTVLGTGVNPGFVMDTLPVFLTTVSQQVKRIKVERVVDASTRRLPLQRKIGSGMSAQEFRQGVSERKLGHVGLRESLEYVAACLGWELDDVKETIDPVMAQKDIETEYLKVEEGQVAGIKHIARGMKDGSEVLTLDLRMYLGAEGSHDLVTIEGTPDLKVEFSGGIPGDQATVAVLVNYIPLVAAAPPGLLTARDLRVPSVLL